MDVGGSGGTDFAAIEIARDQSDAKEKRFMLQGWGIPTAISLLEGLSLQLDIQFVASGGIRSSLDMVRSDVYKRQAQSRENLHDCRYLRKTRF